MGVSTARNDQYVDAEVDGSPVELVVRLGARERRLRRWT